MSGTVDPVTYTVVGADASPFTDTEFDFIVQGTSCVYDGLLYIESDSERAVKQTILEKCLGTKILVLTKHEFLEKPLPHAEPYGSIRNYDFVVIPRTTSEAAPKKQYERRFDLYAPLLIPEILNWNYSIYRVGGEVRTPGPTAPAGKV